MDESHEVKQRSILESPFDPRGELTTEVAISVEIHRTFDHASKPSRVVIVNSQGQRLLDTLVKIEDEMMVIVKPGKKSTML